MIDLTGGIDPAREYVFGECPEDPEMRDSVSFWISDDTGVLALPRIGIEAVGANWANHGVQANVAFADGRVFRLRTDAPSLPAQDADGEPTILGAGPLTCQMIEPFRQWRVSFDGELTQTSTEALIAGEIDGATVPVRFDVLMTMAVPPWEQGALNKQASDVLANSDEGGLMGGPRYEQLFRASGSVTIDGLEQQFNGQGLRIRRQGVRKLATFWGHCWQTAVFPSGKAFGFMAYPPREDGKPTFNEGFVFDGDGELRAARVVEAPWLTEITSREQDVSFVLETAEGEVRIGGETVLSTFDIYHRDKTFSTNQMHAENADFPALQQAGVRYSWGGETTYGMIERSNPLSKITFSEPDFVR
jgi:prepilin-type processing-associated H-X9-DG protein